MSDDFTVCNNCGVENELVNIQLMYGRLGKKARERVDEFYFCLACGKTQLKSKTQWRHVEYQGTDTPQDREDFDNAVKDNLAKGR